MGQCKHDKLCFMGVPEGKKKGVKTVFEETMAKTNLKKVKDIWVQETQRVPNKMNPNRPTPKLNWKNERKREDF